MPRCRSTRARRACLAFMWPATLGARIGLADELKPKFRVAWVDEKNPQAGYHYLYLTAADYQALPQGSVQGKLVGERFVLDAVVGEKDGIGVENLRGRARSPARRRGLRGRLHAVVCYWKKRRYWGLPQ